MNNLKKPTEAFDAINKYLGWGDPKGGVWFVGIEEREGWSNKKQVIDFCSHNCPFQRNVERNWNGQKGNIIPLTCKVIHSLSEVGRKNNWEEYRNNYLWRTGYKVFQTNLFPLGKPSLGIWPPEYKEIFGLGSDDWKIYLLQVRKVRFQKIRELREKYKPQAIICFGKTFWDKHRELFQISVDTKTILGDNLECYDEDKIILTPFFGWNWMNDEKASAITKKLKKWNVQLP